MNLGILLKESGRTAEAEPAYRRALDLNTALADQFPDVPVFRRDRARCLNNLADLVMATSPRPAEEMLRKALALDEALADGAPGVPEYRAGVAGVLGNLGRCLKAAGQVEPSLESFRRGADLYEPLIVADPANPNYRRDQAGCLNNLGNTLSGLGRHNEAEEAFRRAVGRLDELVALPSPHAWDRLELANTLSNRGDNQKAGKLPGAEATFGRALEQFGRLVAEPGASPPMRAGLAIARSNFGDWLAANGRGDDAETSFAESVRILDGLTTGDPPQLGYRPLLAEVLGHRAALRVDRGRPADARGDLEWAARIERAAVEANPRSPLRARLRAHVASLVGVLVELGEHAEAARECEEWLRLAHDRRGARVEIARALVRCAARALADAAMPEARRVALAGSYQDRAASMLREAVERGDAEAASLLLDEAFAPIRSRDGFKALVVGPAAGPVSSEE